jgi:hypothetical protein
MHLEIGLLHIILINFFVANISVCLTLSGFLRLISLVKGSEAAGLQLFGQENVAIFIIRLISFIMSSILSIIFPFIVIHVYGAYPFLMGHFYGKENFSNLAVKQNIFTTSFAILPAMAAITSLAVKLYSFWITRQMNNAFVKIFYIDIPKNNLEEKYALSIVHVMVLPLPIVATVMLSSLYNLKMRLLVFCPIQVWLLAVVLPIAVLLSNKKMRVKFKQNFVIPKIDRFALPNIKTMSKNRVGTYSQ